ncbi:glutathione-dependent disulfide-bond oxidoreductase [Pseudoalteromonas sp. AOP31-A2-14]|uniref:glutathione-dependent disulfide-bond oxidoreductase n=1 Tax=Pseudoalteromonas sp. AOP31-A2-14 TaxID=3457695 RepID=UPI0040374458
MSNSENYTPPKVWHFDADNGGEWAKTNRPTAGATHQQDLPKGEHALQLYSLATPNGQKATIMLEELLELGKNDADYDAFLIKIGDGDQFSSGFVNVNPNSKIPALMDHSTTPTTRVFESGAILQYLAEKFNALIPEDHTSKTECRNWLFWQMGSAPYLGGGFGHFYAYAPYKMKYPIDRFTLEVKRQLDVLNRHLSDHDYMAGSEYSIADIAIWPWYGSLVLGDIYDAGEFLDVESYTHVLRWAKQIARRPAVKRGRRVNRTWGDEDKQLAERHSKSDF